MYNVCYYTLKSNKVNKFQVFIPIVIMRLLATDCFYKYFKRKKHAIIPRAHELSAWENRPEIRRLKKYVLCSLCSYCAVGCAEGAMLEEYRMGGCGFK